MQISHSSIRCASPVAPLACCAVLLMGASGSYDAPAGAPVSSTFDTGVEEWVVKDLNCGNYASVLGTYALNWFSSGGDPGAHVGLQDPTGNCYFFDAPAAYLGDRSAFAGAALRFSLRTTVNDWPPGSVLVLIGGNGIVLVHDFDQPTSVWSQYEVPLEAAGFRVNSAGGAPASPAQMAAVLGDLEALRISAEYGSEQGAETTFLDSVVFGAPLCPADLNDDGSVDGADLGILLSAWGSTGAPDLDGSGAIDGGDLGALLAAWGPC
jgi:hypothetical protein